MADLERTPTQQLPEGTRFGYHLNADGTYSPIYYVGDLDGIQTAVEALDNAVSGTNLSVIAPNMSTATAITGQITVTTAGTAVQGGNVALTNGVFIKALAGNTGKVYVGNDGAGDVTSSNGFELAAGDLIVVQVANLNVLWFDSATNGDKFCWLKA